MPCHRRKVRAGATKGLATSGAGPGQNPIGDGPSAPEDLPHLVSLDGVEISWARRRKEVLAHRPTDFICALVERRGVRQKTNSLFQKS